MTKPDLPHISKKRRISSLTLVILAVNIIPLLIMGFGIFYLGKYKENLLASAYIYLSDTNRIVSHILEDDPAKIRKLADDWPDGVSLFYIDQNYNLVDVIGTFWESTLTKEKDPREIRNFAETFASLFVYLNPLQTTVPALPIKADNIDFQQMPEVKRALKGEREISAWTFNKALLLTSVIPIHKNSAGETRAAMLVMSGEMITKAIDDVREDIIQAFIIVIILTFLLSVYLSSFIAIPLKRLGRAAEDIRIGRRDLTGLPDMSNRRDEIGELSVILRQMVRALESRIDTIQNFAADVSHEIKNPITSLRSAIETALALENKEKRDGLLKIMEQDVHRLDRLITDISRHSRLDSELARDNYQVVDLKSLLAEVVDLWRNPIERGEERRSASGLELIETSFPESDCYVLGKGDSLGQVFQNLIANAISFHQKGRNPVRVQMFVTNNNVIIIVEDNGPGIPNKQLAKIFDRFYSDRPEGHDKSRNSGLGLSIAKQIIDAHDGTIRAENIYNHDKSCVEGARFIVTLKLYNA